MKMCDIIIFVIFLFFPITKSDSILNRYFSESDGIPISKTVYDDDRVSDADVGMKSEKYIGTFGNRAIVTRQENTFVDQDGVPVPMLPYHETYRTSNSLPTYRKFMNRERNN